MFANASIATRIADRALGFFAFTAALISAAPLALVFGAFFFA
jgi:hypothetical protein